MPKYQLLEQEEAQPTGEMESISIKQLRDFGVKKQTSFLLENGVAVKGSIKVEKFNQKFSLAWESAKTRLFHKQSYVPYIAKNGEIRNKKSGSLSVSTEDLQSE